LNQITDIIEKTNPMAVFTVEGVKSVREISGIVPPEEPHRFPFLRGLMRK
jgi:hypothetical protein